MRTHQQAPPVVLSETDGVPDTIIPIHGWRLVKRAFAMNSLGEQTLGLELERNGVTQEWVAEVGDRFELSWRLVNQFGVEGLRMPRPREPEPCGE